MGWSREHLSSLNELLEQGAHCEACHRPMIAEGHQKVFSLIPDVPGQYWKGLLPSFNHYSVYFVQCECGAWFHGDCLMPMQRLQPTSIEVQQPNGVVAIKGGLAHTISCPRCGHPLWVNKGRQPHPWTIRMEIKLPATSEAQTELIRNFEIFLQPHLTRWPSIAIRQRKSGTPDLAVYPYPRGGQLPNPDMLTSGRGWLGDASEVVKHRIVREIYTNEAIITALLGGHIAERERTRVERENLAQAFRKSLPVDTATREESAATSSAQVPAINETAPKKEGLFDWFWKEPRE